MGMFGLFLKLQRLCEDNPHRFAEEVEKSEVWEFRRTTPFRDKEGWIEFIPFPKVSRTLRYWIRYIGPREILVNERTAIKKLIDTLSR